MLFDHKIVGAGEGKQQSQLNIGKDMGRRLQEGSGRRCPDRAPFLTWPLWGGCVYHLSLNSLRRYCELGLKVGIAGGWCSCDIVDLGKETLNPGGSALQVALVKGQS